MSGLREEPGVTRGRRYRSDETRSPALSIVLQTVITQLLEPQRFLGFALVFQGGLRGYDQRTILS